MTTPLFPDLGDPFVDLTVGGRPAPQGSKRAFAIKKGGKFTGKVAMVESSKKGVDSWRGDVMAAAASAMFHRHGHATRATAEHLPYEPQRALAACEWDVCGPGCGHPFPLAPKPNADGLVAVMVFTRPRPGAAPKARRWWASTTPDLSKLLRSTEDALTAIGLWKDDGRVVAYRLAAKVFPGEGALWPGCPDLSLPEPGARVILWRSNAGAPPAVTEPQAERLPIGEL